jgi:quinol monooxygenase YgiN
MERGCLAYDIFQDPANAHRNLIFERWEDHDHWRAHVETQHLQDFKNDVLGHQAEMNVEVLTSAS